MHFRTLVFVANAKKSALVFVWKLCCFKRASKCALCCSLNWWYIWNSSAFQSFVIFQFFLFQEFFFCFTCFSLVLARKKFEAMWSYFLYVDVMHSMIKLALFSPVRLMCFELIFLSAPGFLKVYAFSRKIDIFSSP